MAEVTYPYGYGQAFATMDQLVARFGPDAPIPPHPEYWRRIVAWLESRGGDIGIGGAYRFVQPDLDGFAPAGKSFHEKQRFASGFEGYSAIDLVARNDGKRHRAPRWDEVPKQGSGHPDIAAYGVHCNVDKEPWHIQCREIDGWTSWVNAGRRDPQTIALPDGGGGGGSVSPSEHRTLKLANPQMSGDDVVYVQQSLAREGVTIACDGFYGPQTEDRVKLMQGWNKLEQDGICGPKTWAVVEEYNA